MLVHAFIVEAVAVIVKGVALVESSWRWSFSWLTDKVPKSG